MQIGDITLIMGVLSLGILVILGANYLGLTPMLQVIVQFFTGMIGFINGVISMMPRPMKIFLFLIGGVAVLGLITSWFVASDVVCVEKTVWRAPTLVDSVYAKLLPTTTTTFSATSNFSQVPLIPFTESSTTTLDRATLSLGNIFYYDALGVAHMAVPEDQEVVEGELDIIVCKRWFGACTTDTSSLIRDMCAVGSGKVAHFRYSTDGTAWRVYDMMLTSIGVSGYSDISECNDSQTGTLLNISAGDRAFNMQPQREAGMFEYETAQSGYVEGVEYITSGEAVTRIDASGGVGGSRKSYVVREGTQFTKVVGSSSDAVSYTCDADDSIVILFFGIDIFNWTTLVVIIVLFGMIGLLKWMGIV